MSEDLSWNKHVENITTTATKTLNFLCRNIKTQNQKIREVSYKTLVRPQLEYSSSVWSPNTKVNINRLEKVQNRDARWTTNDFSYYNSVTAMRERLQWQTLQDPRDIGRITMFYKIIHGYVAVPIPSYLERPTRLTRHMHPFYFRQIHTTSNFYKYSFFPATVVMWNSLPAAAVLQPDIKRFKTALNPSIISNRP